MKIVVTAGYICENAFCVWELFCDAVGLEYTCIADGMDRNTEFPI